MRDLIRQRLIEEMKASGKSVKEMAEALGISHTNISQYKTKDKLPTLENFAKLCKIIGADANYILGITDN